MQLHHISSEWLKRWREHLKLPRNDEIEQAVFRILICLVLTVFLAVARLFEDSPDTQVTTQSAILVTGGYLFFGALLLIWIRNVPAPLPARRVLAMFLDFVAISGCLYFAGDYGSVLFAAYLWVSFGYGFRYGRRYLIASTIMSIVGFGVVYVTSDYWEAHRVSGAGWFVGLAVLPLFVSRLVRRLMQLTEEAKQASVAKTRFLANMSHEIRTPLNAVIGMSHVLSNTDLTSKQREFVDAIQTSGTALLGLLENVLDLSKIEAGRYAVEDIDLDLHEIIADAVKVVELTAINKGLRLRTEIDPTVPFDLRGDPVRLRQVLVNLLGNAVKFTAHGSVILRMRRHEFVENDSWLRFEIEDTGIGIAEHAKARIFDIFTQADSSTSRQFGGTGLGTAISSQLVGLMGGRIGFDSQEGVGSTFWFEIPLRQRATSITADSAPTLPMQRVLVVVRADVMAEDIRSKLAGWGVKAIRVTAISAALAQLQESMVGRDGHIDAVVVSDEYRNVALFDFIQRLQKLDHDETYPAVLQYSNTMQNSHGEFVRAGYAVTIDSDAPEIVLYNALHALGKRSRTPGMPEIRKKEQLPCQYHVLVAEDNKTNQLVLQNVLESAGHHVVMTSNGEEALEAIEQHHVDIAVLDMHMPGIDGLEVLRIIRYGTKTKRDLPVIFLTADVMAEAIAEAKQSGVDAYLTKPVDPRHLLSEIDRLMHQGHSDREPQNQVHPPKTEYLQNSIVDTGILHSFYELGMSGNDCSFLRKIVSAYQGHAEDALNEAKIAIATTNLSLFRKSMAGLQKSAASVGAIQLASLCGTIAHTASADLASQAVHLLAEVHALHGQTCACIDTYMRDRQRDDGVASFGSVQLRLVRGNIAPDTEQ